MLLEYLRIEILILLKFGPHFYGRISTARGRDVRGARMDQVTTQNPIWNSCTKISIEKLFNIREFSENESLLVVLVFEMFRLSLLLINQDRGCPQQSEKKCKQHM